MERSEELREARERLPRTVALVEQGLSDGQHIGAQLYVSLAGTPVVDFGIGASRPGVPMDRDSMMPWMSASKASTPVAVAQQWQLGKFDLDDPAAHYIPEFGVLGKERITIRHLLTLVGGFRAPMGSNDSRLSWDEQIALYCAAPLREGWEIGRQAAYGPTSWFILGEIVRRVSGRPYAQYVRDGVMLPLGMQDSWLGMPLDRVTAYGERIGLMHDLTDGTSVPAPRWTSPQMLASCAPNGGSVGPIRELAFIYEMLNGRGVRHGVRLLDAVTVEALMARQTVGVYDVTLRTRVSRCFGLMVDSQGFGRHRSPRSVGHPGGRNSVGFCDPEFGLAVGFVANGDLPGPRHSQRISAIASSIYKGLGLASAQDPGRDGDVAPNFMA